MLGALLRTNLKKAGIELSLAEQEKLIQDVSQAVLQTEEQARRTEMSSQQKAETATRIVLQKRPELPPAQVRDLIDATLPKIRAQLGAGLR